MRKLGITTLLAFFFAITLTTAQTEVKLNPLALAFGDFQASAEFLQTDNITLESSLSVNSNGRTFSGVSYDGLGFEVGGQAKYFVKPKTAADRFYLGVYSTYARMGYDFRETETDAFANNKLNAGFSLGYKWVTEKGFVFEIGSGLGKAFVNNDVAASGSNVDLTTINISDLHIPGRLSIGFRF